MLVCEGKMHFAEKVECWCESGHPYLLEILLDCKHWYFSLSVGDFYCLLQMLCVSREHFTFKITHL